MLSTTPWLNYRASKEEAEAALTTAQKVLEELRLTLHPEKTRIVDVRDTTFDFLGFTFFWVVSKDGSGRPLFGPKQAAIERFKDTVRELTRRTRPMNLQMVIDDLAPVIRGWGQYFTISHNGNYYRLDAWIRERCRAFVAKRWNRSPALDAEWTNIRLTNMGLPSLAVMRKAQLPRP